MERLLVLGAGAGQVGLLAAARERGLFVIAVDRDAGAPGFRYADRRAIVSVDDEPALERLAEAERIDGVAAPGADWPVGPAARIAARLGVPHPISPETALLSTSKLRQRERFAEAGVPQTGWKVVTRADEVVGVPCLVRAPDRHGRRARALVRSSRELRAAVKTALRASRIGLCLVEELAEEPADAAVALARQAADALEIQDGASVTQLRIGPDGPRVQGVSARTGGGHEAELCQAALGVDLNSLALAAALGEPISERRLRPRRRVGGACVLFLTGAGEAEGLAEAQAVAGIEWARVYGCGSDRAGAVLATGESRAQALERATRAAECVRFRAADAQALA